MAAREVLIENFISIFCIIPHSHSLRHRLKIVPQIVDDAGSVCINFIRPVTHQIKNCNFSRVIRYFLNDYVIPYRIFFRDWRKISYFPIVRLLVGRNKHTMPDISQYARNTRNFMRVWRVSNSLNMAYTCQARPNRAV